MRIKADVLQERCFEEAQNANEVSTYQYIQLLSYLPSTSIRLLENEQTRYDGRFKYLNNQGKRMDLANV